MKKIIFLLFITTATFAQDTSSTFEETIEKIEYKKVSNFLSKHFLQCKKMQENWNVPGGLCLAQMALETGWGLSEFYIVRKNCLGIKLNHKYCWFKTFDDCLEIYGRTLSNSCYKELQPSSVDDWLKALDSCKYATSESYQDKLKSIINKYEIPLWL